MRRADAYEIYRSHRTSCFNRSRRTRQSFLCGTDRSEPAVPASEIGDGGAEVVAAEAGQERVVERQFRTRGFKEEGVAEAFLAAGADQQIDVFDGGVGVDGRRQALAEVLLRAVRAGSPGDGIARGVVDGE